MNYPQRIVCLTEETTETLYAIGAEDRIVGISGFTVRPERAKKEKPKVSAFTSAKIGRIVELKPDLVLGFSDMQADIAAELVRNGVAVHIFNQRTVAGILSMIRTLGGMLGLSAKTDAYAHELAARVERVRLEKMRTNRPRVYFEEWGDPIITGIGWVSELIGIAGGEDIFPEKAAEPGAKERIIQNPEEVVNRKPDIIIGSWCGRKFRPDQVAGRSGWEAIPAVANNHLYEIKSPLILQPGPAALTDGLDALCEIIDRV
ncbi:cobalamin-binding protein [Marinobacter sp. ELB17]|uniref:cobalamin-binding protein n=1 Tax=Marinobacter sp. ELB17 TaxID=270374 RepID=UPI0000F3ACA6|nr:cobalamin-binding protein [Marinobacter sp. ELB17]EAZ99054.1 metal chelate ABC transporter, metal chelate-binding protein [Marinobacter sp. ELB17]